MKMLSKFDWSACFPVHSQALSLYALSDFLLFSLTLLSTGQTEIFIKITLRLAIFHQYQTHLSIDRSFQGAHMPLIVGHTSAHTYINIHAQQELFINFKMKVS